MELLKRAIKKIEQYGKLVMFSHTIFSFSFAAIAFLLASNGKPNIVTLFWAAVALLGARTGANSINRLIDAKIDAANPRTADRQLPRGEMKAGEVLVFTVVCFALLVFAAFQLNMLCFALSPLALLCMVMYSYTKRFTWLCHLFLGVTCSIAPVGAWLAVTGTFSLTPLVLAAINCLWVAGFDVIYGTQDYEFDKSHGLHSIPVQFGIKGALRISTLFHVAALLFFVLFILLETPPMGLIMWAAFVIVAGLVFLQHWLVKDDASKNVKIASYSVSQITSLVILIFGILDIYL